MSLTATDLDAIGTIVHKTVKPMFDDLSRQIVKLSDATAAGFNQVFEHFTEIDERFDQIDRRFEQVDRRFEQVDRRFDEVDARFDRIEVRLTRVENDTSRLRGNFMGLKRKVVDNNP